MSISYININDDIDGLIEDLSNNYKIGSTSN